VFETFRSEVDVRHALFCEFTTTLVETTGVTREGCLMSVLEEETLLLESPVR
jgi:hypothetical protein